MTDLDDTARLPQPAQRAIGGWRGMARGDVARPERRQQRIARERMQHVRDDQLLMLLFVMQPECNLGRQQVEQRGICRGDRVQHGRVDMTPVRMHVGQRGTRQKAALFPRLARAERFVVGVEQERIGIVERGITGDVPHQHDCLEEPRRMREMPLRRAGVGHRLHGLIFGSQRRRQLDAACANVPIIALKLGCEEAHRFTVHISRHCVAGVGSRARPACAPGETTAQARQSVVLSG